MKKSTKHLLPVLLAAVFMLSACNLPFLTGSAEPTADPGENAPTEQVVEESPAPGSISGDACLQGTWAMEQPDVEAFLQSSTGITSFKVPSGRLVFVFNGNSYTYSSEDFILRFEISPEQYTQASAVISVGGTFSSDGEVLTFNNTTDSITIDTWVFYLNGESTALPGTAPELDLNSIASGPFQCSGNTLTFLNEYTPTPYTMVFKRTN